MAEQSKSGWSRGGKRQGASTQVAKRGGQGSPVWQESHKAKREKSSVLRTYIVGGVGVKKLHFHWRVKVVSAFRGRHDYPNVGIGGCLLAQVFILL